MDIGRWKSVKILQKFREKNRARKRIIWLKRNQQWSWNFFIRNCIKLNKGIWSSYMSVDLYILQQNKSAYFILFLLFLMKKDDIKVIRFQNTKYSLFFVYSPYLFLLRVEILSINDYNHEKILIKGITNIVIMMKNIKLHNLLMILWWCQRMMQSTSMVNNWESLAWQ